MAKILDWYRGLTKWPQLFIRSFLISIPFYFAAYLSNSVSVAYSQQVGNSYLIHGTIYLVILTIVIFISMQIKDSFEAKLNLIFEQKQNIYHAYTLAERASVRSIDKLKKYHEDHEKISTQAIASLDKIQELVNAAYSTFESLYSSNSYDKERIDFEITFMTMSYIDGKITIPASANRDCRRPRSMVIRKQHPDIYDNTVTARIYKAIKPTCQIINNTTESSANYFELYAGQKERIKSSIVYPVLSSDNELLGTLVAHCDKIDFFHFSEQKFWIDLLEVFSKGIAAEKIKIDMVYNYLKKHSKLEIPFDNKIFF